MGGDMVHHAQVAQDLFGLGLILIGAVCFGYVIFEAYDVVLERLLTKFKR